MRKKIIKRVLFILLGTLCVVIVSMVAYISYLAVNYERVDDLQEIMWENPSMRAIALEKEYTIMTYNVGFGAYDREYSFFMDKGEMLNGQKVKGKYAKASSIEAVQANTAGALSIIQGYDPDFLFLQEVDIEATRSYYYNQYGYFADNLSEYASFFATNFNSAYLLYPFNQPIGRSHSGLAFFSKYITQSPNVRYSLPVDNGFFARFFDLDRCFTVSRALLDDTKEIVFINVHLSAYDDGGKIKKQQMEMINEFLKAESAKGNHVIVGGDFNLDLANTIDSFPTEQKTPNWVVSFEPQLLPSGFVVAASSLTATCRSADMPYQEGVNYTVVIDGYIVSEKIEVLEVINITTLSGEDVNFKYSDHNPVLMRFKIKNILT